MLTEEEKDNLAYALQFAKLSDEEVKQFKKLMKEQDNE